ncbi:MAG: cytochrome b [Planctomycetota bacterium]|jgi:cytochrome b
MHSNLEEQENPQIKVWDIGVRIFHWSLVLFYTIAYISEDIELIHVYAGYVVLGLILFRVLWGLIGTKYARFNDFIFGKKVAFVYFKSLFTKNPKHYIGHNPIAGWMILALLITIFLVAWTGLLLYADTGKGPLAEVNVELISRAYADDDGEQSESIWEEIHEVLASLTLLLVCVHVAGVLLSSIIHGENLIRSMITGYKKSG